MSEGNGGGKPTADEGQQAAAQTNINRLRTHLPEGSLAAKLVVAYAGAGVAASAEALAKVATDRLDELRHDHGRSEDNKD